MKKYFSIICLAVAGMMTVCSCCSDDEPELKPGQEQGGAAEDVVDLGLSVKWATCNLGSDSPEKRGDFYAWGETATKSSYTDSNYFDSSFSLFSSNGTKSISGGDCDAATVKLGSDWRMPTRSEIAELVNGCTWKDETLNGVRGMRGTASNGNSIFLPLTGMFAGGEIMSEGQACYWSGDVSTSKSNQASFLTFFAGGDVHPSEYYRWEGMAIRPVYVGKGLPNGGENQGENGEDEPNGGSTVPEDATGFVGYWVNSNFAEYHPDLYLSSDGICWVVTTSMDNKWSYDYTWYTHYTSGNWGYDKESKILATTVGTWQFDVTLKTDYMMSCVYKTGKKTYNQSFQKATQLGVANLMKELNRWKDGEDNKFDLKYYDITEDEDDSDWTFNYQTGSNKGKMKITNPYLFSKLTITLSGAINATLH